MSNDGPEWGDNKQIVIESRNKSSFGLDINGLKESVYDLTLYYSKSPEFGNADIYVNTIKAGTIHGYSPYVLPDGKVTLKELKNRAQAIEIRFVVTGKDALSKGYYIGLDGISLEPKRVYIPDWYVLGPFANPRKIGAVRRGLDSVYLPEKVIDLQKDYRGAANSPLRWTLTTTPSNGHFSLLDNPGPHELVVNYALTYVFAPENRKTTLFIGTDDGGKVFLNGAEVYRYLGERVAEPDQAEVELALKAGWNTLLLKIENNYGAYGFYARLVDSGRNLVISAEKKLPTELTN
jgi:hypothetical protein